MYKRQASGISLAFQGLNENFKVRTCEPENFDDMARSLKQRSRVTNKALDGSILRCYFDSHTWGTNF